MNTQTPMVNLKHAIQAGRCLAVLPSPSRKNRSARLLFDRDVLQHGLVRLMTESPEIPWLLFGYSGRLFEIDFDERLAIMSWLAESFPPAGQWVAGARSADELARMLALGLHQTFVFMVDFPVPANLPIDHPELTLLFRSAKRGLEPAIWEPHVSRMAAYKEDDYPHAFNYRVAEQLALHRIPIVVGSLKFGLAPVPSYAAAIASSYGFCCAQCLGLGPTQSKLSAPLLAILSELDALRSLYNHKLIDALWSIHWDLGASSHQVPPDVEIHLRDLHEKLGELEKHQCGITGDVPPAF